MKKLLVLAVVTLIAGCASQGEYSEVDRLNADLAARQNINAMQNQVNDMMINNNIIKMVENY